MTNILKLVLVFIICISSFVNAQENTSISEQHKALIEKFYTGFVNGDANEMTACYHEDVVFEDPVFGRLEDGKPAKMWEMLMSRKKESTKVVFSNIEANEATGSGNWTATYKYGEKERDVVNDVTSSFKFKDGKIIEHIDSFKLWKWTRQALGFSGTMLGWTPLMKNKIQDKTNEQLSEYMK